MSRTRTLLFAGGMAVVGATAATATITSAKPTGLPDAKTAVDDVRAGKGRALPTPPGQDVSYSGWWQGCRFVIAKSRVTFYEAPNGREVGMVGAPESAPPREPGCVDRDPTDAEINAMQAEVTDLNARGRPAGAPTPPTMPATRQGQPSARP